MAGERQYVAIDLGAESGRVMLGIVGADKLSLEEIHRFPNGPTNENSSLKWDFNKLFGHVKAGLAKAVKQSGGDIAGIGVDTWGVDFGLLNAEGKLIENPYHYRDSRNNGMMEKAFELMPRREIYENTGLQFMQFNTIYQLLSMRLNKPDVLAKAKRLIFIADLFTYYLCGKAVSEYTFASTSQLLDMRTGEWSKAIFDRLNLPLDIMQSIVKPGTIVGKLTAQLASELNCKQIPVIAVGAHDTASAVAAVPADQKSNWAYLSSGTWSLMGVEVPQAIINDKTYQYPFTNEGGVENTIRLLKNIAGLWLLQECRRQWQKEGTDLSYAQLTDTAAKLEYAVNTGTSVFKEGARYYAVDQGVWYEADSPNGPWTVSAAPPQEVDQLPPSNPAYNAKYVKVYDATPDTVTVGYTPGYTGSYVDNGTVVYGTGYDYPGYAAPDAYIPPPVTYGYAAAYDPYAGSWGCQPSYYNPASWLVPGLLGLAAVGVATSPWWWGGHGPYWGGGGWWGAGGYNNININNIHNNVWRNGHRPDHWRPDHGRPIYHPVTNPRPNLYNRPGNQTKLASRTERPATRPASQVRPGGAARPGQVARPGTRPAQTQVRPAGGKNNVFAGGNGHVYRRDTKGNWQQHQAGQWSKPGGERAAARPATGTRPSAAPARPAAAARPSYDSGRLNQDFAARQRGQERSQNYQRATAARPSPSFSRPSGGGGAGGGFSRPSGGGGGGGFRGGGGGGGRRR